MRGWGEEGACASSAAGPNAMKVPTLAAAAALLPFAFAAPSAKPIILRDLAKPRFFGAAANTTFLFNDKNYTKVISTQVSFHISFFRISNF